MRTDKEIKEEIKKLEDLKSKVAPMTLFGESNIEAIQAAIDALQDGMDEDAAYGMEDDGDFNERERENAVEAIMWREGESEEPVSAAGWPLKKS